MIKRKIIEGYKKARNITNDYELDADENYLVDEIHKAQEQIKLLNLACVSNRRELLIAFANELQNIGFNEMDDVEKVVDIWLKSN